MHAQLQSIHEALGITSEHVTKNRLLVCEQPLLAELEVVDIDFDGKPFILLSAAARAWREMVGAADEDEIVLKPFSGFRSYLHQSR